MDGEWHATKERTSQLQCQARRLEAKLASLEKQLAARRKEAHRLSRLTRQTERQEQLYGRVADRFHKRYMACQSLLDGNRVSGGTISTPAVVSTSQYAYDGICYFVLKIICGR